MSASQDASFGRALAPSSDAPQPALPPVYLSRRDDLVDGLADLVTELDMDTGNGTLALAIQLMDRLSGKPAFAQLLQDPTPDHTSFWLTLMVNACLLVASKLREDGDSVLTWAYRIIGAIRWNCWSGPRITVFQRPYVVSRAEVFILAALDYKVNQPTPVDFAHAFFYEIRAWGPSGPVPRRPSAASARPGSTSRRRRNQHAMETSPRTSVTRVPSVPPRAASTAAGAVPPASPTLLQPERGASVHRSVAAAEREQALADLHTDMVNFSIDLLILLGPSPAADAVHGAQGACHAGDDEGDPAADGDQDVHMVAESDCDITPPDTASTLQAAGAPKATGPSAFVAAVAVAMALVKDGYEWNTAWTPALEDLTTVPRHEVEAALVSLGLGSKKVHL